MSQRELSERSGLTQAQISNVENGADMRLSNLVELARALDLELALVPRKTMPAVESIVRTAIAGAPTPELARRLRDLLHAVERILSKIPDQPQYERLRDYIRDYRNKRLWPEDLETIRRSTTEARRIEKMLNESEPANHGIELRMLDLMQRLQEIAHTRPSHDEVRTRPAYTLDNDDVDG